jgi:acetylornithine deacetylase/succinyl-diaminopimelate desuccinylase-like protein
MEYINNYIEQNKDRFLEDLFGLIRIPSISSLKEKKPQMYRAALYCKKNFL